MRWIACVMLASGIAAQGQVPSYEDLVVVRGRPWAKGSFLEVRAGYLSSFAAGEDASRSVEGVSAADGHVFYREEGAFGRAGRLEAYVGRDGAYASLVDGDPRQGKGYSRLEVHGRQWGNFVREGFYAGDDFVPVGFYEGKDWRARLGFTTPVAPQMILEVGPFYGKNDFERAGRTAANYTIPDDHTVWGAQVRLEENKLEVDQASYLPRQGYILSVWIDREWNGSNRRFGVTGRESSLPASVVRGGAHLEYYIPYTASGTWVVTADGAIGPDDDRIWIYDASKPVGELWVDAKIDYRMLLSDTLTLSAGGRAQWIRIADEFAVSKDAKSFWGAQTSLRLDFSEDFALVAAYSFLSNESRRPVSISRDSLGEHRLFIGFEFRP